MANTGRFAADLLLQPGGFDTHSDQLPQQAQLFGELAGAMAAFDTALGVLGETNNVTTFTESEFRRTFQPNGNAGTDHAWGSNHIVMGGSVKGGTVYGTYPQLALNTGVDSGDRGNWILSSATDQYGAALANWFGLQAADVSYVFPNLANFRVGRWDLFRALQVAFEVRHATAANGFTPLVQPLPAALPE